MILNPTVTCWHLPVLLYSFEIYSISYFRMVHNPPKVLNFNCYFSNSIGSFVTNYQSSLVLALECLMDNMGSLSNNFFANPPPQRRRRRRRRRRSPLTSHLAIVWETKVQWRALYCDFIYNNNNIIIIIINLPSSLPHIKPTMIETLLNHRANYVPTIHCLSI